MNLKKQIKKEKEFLALCRRRDSLYDKVRNSPLQKLEVPYQSGWDIYVDVRDDIKNRKDYPLIKYLIDNHTKPEHTDNVKLVRMCRRIKSWSAIREDLWKEARKHKSLHIPQLFTYKRYDLEFYNNLPEQVKKHFQLRTDIFYLGGNESKRFYTTLEIPDYWIQLKVKPHMVTHERILRPDLISESKEVHTNLEYYRDKGWVPKGKTWNFGSSFPSSNQRVYMRDQISKFLKGEIEDIDTIAVPKEWDW